MDLVWFVLHANDFSNLLTFQFNSNERFKRFSGVAYELLCTLRTLSTKQRKPSIRVHSAEASKQKTSSPIAVLSAKISADSVESNATVYTDPINSACDWFGSIYQYWEYGVCARKRWCALPAPRRRSPSRALHLSIYSTGTAVQGRPRSVDGANARKWKYWTRVEPGEHG